MSRVLDRTLRRKRIWTLVSFYSLNVSFKSPLNVRSLFTVIIPATWKGGQEDHKFNAGLRNLGGRCLKIIKIDVETVQ